MQHQVRKEPSLARTKRLLLAALKVWELKNKFEPEPELELTPEEEALLV